MRVCVGGGVVKMTSLLCKGVSGADGYILLFSDLSLQEKKSSSPLMIV